MDINGKFSTGSCSVIRVILKIKQGLNIVYCVLKLLDCLMKIMYYLRFLNFLFLFKPFTKSNLSCKSSHRASANAN